MSGYGGNQTRRRKTNTFNQRAEIGISPEARLIVAVLARAGLDMLNGNRDATAFVRSPDFDWYCQWVGIDAENLRGRLLAARYQK